MILQYVFLTQAVLVTLADMMAHMTNFSYFCGRYMVECANDQVCPGEAADKELDNLSPGHRPERGAPCLCDRGFVGYDCGLPDESHCEDDICVNGGSCWTAPSGESRCHCTPSYFGSNCQFPRVRVQCFQDGMYINLHPFGEPFSGIVTVKKNSSLYSAAIWEISEEVYDMTARHLPLSSLFHQMDYSFMLHQYQHFLVPYEDCDRVDATKDERLNLRKEVELAYRAELVLLYHPDFLGQWDQWLVFHCGVDVNGRVTLARAKEESWSLSLRWNVVDYAEDWHTMRHKAHVIHGYIGFSFSFVLLVITSILSCRLAQSYRPLLPRDKQRINVY